MMHSLVFDQAVQGIRVARTCRLLGFSKQAFYAWPANPISQRDWDDDHLADAAINAHTDDPVFGYRRIHDELTLTHGLMVGRTRVARLCRKHQVVSMIVKRRRRAKVAGPVVHDDLVQRQFKTSDLDRAWFADITAHSTSEGKLHVCAVKEACSNRIMGLSMGLRMTSDLACDALRYAIAGRSPDGTVMHEERGGQLRSRAFATTLRSAGVHASSGGVAHAADRAAMESCFGLLQKRFLNRQRGDNREQICIASPTCIERDYYRGRGRAALGNLAPIESKTIHEAATAP